MKLIKKVFSLTLIIIMVMNFTTIYGQVDETSIPNDIKGHWAEKVLVEWINDDLLKGFPDGTIRPDSVIPKVEFIVLVNRIYGFYEEAEINYTDISENDWFEKETAIAKESGYMDWYEEEHFKPMEKIPREEVCAILYHVMQLEEKADMIAIEEFSDFNSISDWSKRYINAVVANRYMSGYMDNTLRVENGISRAEAVVMLNRVIGELINTAGTYGSNEETKIREGNLTINTGDVLLQNHVIKGDLILAAGIGEGNVTLENVKVEGKTIINGGGENSVIIKNSDIGEIIVFKINGKIRVVSSESSIGKIIQLSGGKLEGKYPGVEIEILAEGQEVELDGDFEKIVIHAKAKIEITEDTKVKKLKVEKEAEGTQIETEKGTEIEEMIINAPTEVKADGEIEKVKINSEGVNIEESNSKQKQKQKKDKKAPSGYSVNIDQSNININNQADLSFTFSEAEVGSTYNYTITSSAGGTDVTGTGSIITSTDQITGIDVSGLDDGTLTLDVTLTDRKNNTGVVVNDTIDKDATAPNGYSVSIDQSAIDNSNETALSFTFSGAEVATTYSYAIISSEGGTDVTGSGAITTSNQTIIGIDVSGLNDGTLSLQVTLTDHSNNTGLVATDTVNKKATIPNGYSVSIEQSYINVNNQTDLSFTIIGAEAATTYNYTITSSTGGTEVLGSGNIITPTDQITEIDVSGLNDGTLTLSVTITDSFSNTGIVATDTVDKDILAPIGYSVDVEQTYINNSNENAMSFTFSGAEIDSTYNYAIDDTNGSTGPITGSGTISSAIQTITGINVSPLDDDILSLTLSLTDIAGNLGSSVSDSVYKDTSAPSGYGVSINQSKIDSTNDTAMSFTFAGAELGSTYNYAIDDTNESTMAVTGNGTISSATQTVSTIDVRGLDDDTLSLSVSLSDIAGNWGISVSDSVYKKATAPSGYGVSINQSKIDSSNETALSFTFSDAEVGTTYDYTITSSAGGTDVTGTGSITTATDQITGINVSGLNDGTLTLSVMLTDSYGNTSSVATDTIGKDSEAPSGYSVMIDQSNINANNQADLSFTFGGAETGTTYNYTISSGAGGTDVTGTGSITTSTDQITGIDVSGLNDGTLTLSVTLTDSFSNIGTIETDTVDKDIFAPSGYSVDIDQGNINSGNENAMSFTISSAEVGSTYNYAIDDTNGSTAALTGSGTISSATQTLSTINVSGLDDDTLSLTVYLTDIAGNVGSNVTDTVVKDATAPSGYTVTIDQSEIDSSNETALSFTFSDAEVGTTYDYTITSSAGGTDVTGTGSITTATDQITGINVSGLNDGTLTLSVMLTDSYGNTSSVATDTIGKDSEAPSGYSVMIDQSNINANNQADLSFTFGGAETGTTYNYTISSGAGGTDVTGTGSITTSTDQITGIDVSGLNDGTLTLSVTLTDSFSNIGTIETDTVDKDIFAPSGYSVDIDQGNINSGNENAMSFTISSAEVGSTYNYAIDDTNGSTSAVTGSGTISSATQTLSTINVSGLDDDTLSLTVYLTDIAGNVGSNVTDTVVKDATAPSGYTVTIDQSEIDSSNETALSFTFSDAEVGTTYDYTITSSAGGTDVTGTGSITTATDQITGIDVSGLNDGTLTLSVMLTDSYGNTSSVATDTIGKDSEAPSGYSVMIDQSNINANNQADLSFTFGGAETGTTYNYTISSGAGGTDVTGTGSITTSTDQITGIDVSGLNDGTLTLSVTLTDSFSNIGTIETDTVDKDIFAPSGYSVDIDQGNINSGNENAMSFTISSAEVGSTYNYAIDDTNGSTSAVTGSGTISSATQTLSTINVSGLDDDTLSLTVYLTDIAGNVGSNVTDTVVKDATAPSGYTVTIDQSEIDSSNETALSFTFSDAEVGTTYDYTITSSAGGTDVTGTGSITTATDQITGINVSGLNDGTLTLSVMLTDSFSNTGTVATDIVNKMTALIPTSYVLRWRLDGNGNDETGTRNLDYTEGMPIYNSVVKKENTHSLELDGQSYVSPLTSYDGSNFSNDAMTISAWVNIKSVEEGNRQDIICWTNTYTWFSYNVWGDKKITGYIENTDVNDDDGLYEVKSTTQINNDQWYHIVYVWDGTNKQLKLYINGILEDIISAPNAYDIRLNNAGNEYWYIGYSFFANNNHVNGYLDDIIIYQRPLTDQEVQQLYNSY